nr:hypothetical protein [Tanacetum cinerariifolium]
MGRVWDGDARLNPKPPVSTLESGVFWRENKVRCFLPFKGIYVGENKVVHFTTGEKGYKSIQDSCLTCPDCGFHQPGSGVVLSCLDCFIGTGSLYFFQYGTNAYVSISRLRSGTCTIAKSDPPQDVIHRAMYLLQNGFGNYSLVLNNCENFALYCKTSLLCSKWDNAGSSGQVNGWVMSPLNIIVSSAVKIARCSTPVAAVVGTGMHCLSRYMTDIGVRKDVVKVNVEDMALFRI